MPSRQNKPMPEENTEVLLSSGGLRVEGLPSGGLSVGSLPSRRHAQTMDNMQRAKEQDPDRTALVQRLSKQTGYLPEFVDSNLEELKKQQDAPTNAELDEMQQYAPLTYSYLNDKDFAVLLQDEYRKMGFFERHFKMVVNAFTRAWKQDTLADLRIKQRQADLENNAYAQGFDDEIELLEREIADIAEPRGSLISGAPFYAAEFGAQMLLSQPDALGAALSGAALGAGGGAAAGSVVPGVGTAAGAAAGAKYGFKGGYVAGLAKYASDLEGGLAYGELRNLRDANGKPLPVEVAIDASKTVGLINAALETAGDLVFVGGVLKPAGKLAAKAGSRVMGKTVSSVLGKTLAKIPGADGLVKIIEQNPAAFEGLSLRRTFMEAAKMWALTTSSEVATEYAQNAVQLGTEEAAKAKSGQPFERRSVKEVLTQSAQDMDKVLVGAGTLGLLGFGGNFHRYFSEVRQAERVGELYKQLGEGVKDLKLTERAPEKTVAFLAEQTNGTPLENIYIPVTAVDRVAQENNLDPHEFLQSIGPDVAAQYEEAKATGGNIEVKTSLWAVQSQLISKLTGKPIYEAFANDVKASPDARTKNELQEEQNAINKTAEEADKMILEGSARQDELDQAKDAIRLIFDRAVPPANMGEEMWEQQKEANAELLAKLFVVEAKKRGQDFAEFAEHLQLPIVQTRLNEHQKQAFNQAKEVYKKIKNALTENEETFAASQKGGKTPVLDFLIKKGGVQTENSSWTPETENWRKKESNITGLVNNKTGLLLEEAVSAVQEYLQSNGYGSLIPMGENDAYAPGIPDLIEAVNREMTLYTPISRRTQYNKKLNELLNVSSGQFKTLYEKEFGEKLPDRGSRALKNLHYFLLREAVRDAVTPSQEVLAEYNISPEALAEGQFDFGTPVGSGLLQEINYPINPDVLEKLDKPMEVVKIPLSKIPQGRTLRKSFVGGVLKVWNKLYGQSTKYEVRTLHNEETGWTATLSNNAAGEIFTSANREGRLFGQQTAYAIASNIGPLFEKAVLVKTHPDSKHNRKGVKAIHRFFVPAEINGEIFSVKLTVREFENRKILSIEDLENNGERDFAVYTLAPVKKITPDGTYGDSFISEKVARPASGAVNSLGIKTDSVKPTLRELLREVSDSSGSYNRGIDGREMFQKDTKDFQKRARGIFNDLTNTITLTPEANATTLTHELAHYWLNERWKYMQSGVASQAYQRDFKPLADYLGIKEGQKDLTREQHEKFAKSFEAYLSEGEAPSADLGRIFARFRRWMLRTYKDIKQALGVELNDDIRRVFDRMLATEEEIAQMERERIYEPFTKVPGMTEEDVRRLARLREDAHNEAVTRIMKEQMEELRLEMQQKRDFVEQKEFERVEQELSGQEEYVLANVVESHFAESDFVKNNKKSGAKLPTAQELAAAFKDNSFTQKDRDMWTIIAESNGMDAVNMAERLSALEPLDLVVAKETQRRMDKYDLNKDMKNLRQAAAQALTNEKALEVVALERELFLNKKRSASVQRALESKEIAKKYAREWLSKKPARQAARYQLYFSAQKKAATKAARALANKDYELAAELKMQELFNAACAAESIRISKSLNRGLEFLKFTQRKKGGLLKKQEHFLQVADLLMRLGFPRRDYDPSMKIESLAAWVKRYKERGFDGVQIPDWLLNDSRDLDWRKLPMGALQQAIDAIKNIQHTANFEDRLFSMNRRQTITELAWEVSQHLNKTISKEERKKHEDQVEFEENEVKKGISEYLYSMTKLNTLLTKADGYKDFGFMYEIFERPTKEAADKESVRLRKFREDYQKLIDEYYTKEEVQDIFEVKKYHPELGNECTKERLLSMALNMGNETNRQRLFNNPPIGYNYLKGIDGKDNLWTQESVESLLRKNLTAKDWEFVQGVWNLIDEPWSEVSQMHKRLTGFAPGKVEAMPFAIATADGKNIALHGGYYPIKYDWRGSRWAEREEYLSQPLYTEANQAWVASTKTGHTKARAKEVGSPLMFSINLVERHMTEVIHDLYFRPVVADLRRMLDNDVMRETLIKNLGRQGYNLLKAHLNMIATGGQETSGIGVINKTVEWLRRHMTVAVLAGKTSVLFENFANPWLFVKAIDGFEAKDALQGFALALSEYGPGSLVGAQRAKDLREWVFEKSPLMKDKSENFDITMRQLKKTTIFGEDSKLLEFTNAAMVATDDFFAVPMWVTAYKKFNAQFLAQNKTEAQADKLAVERADMLINRVLGSGRKYDAAEIMRNKNAIVRTLNMFATFMNNEYNRWSRETGLFLKERDALRYAGFVGGRLLAWQLVSQMLAGKWPEDLDAESLLKWWFSGVVDNVSGMFVGLRDILPVMVDKIMGWPSFGYRPTPLSGAMEDLVLRPVQAVSAYARGKRSGQDTAETLAKAASYAAPYPGQLNTWFFNAYDYVFNAMTPRVSDVYRRRPKKERSE